MIKAGIFDIGGVLIEWSSEYMFEDIIRSLNVTQADIDTHWDQFMHLFEQGTISERDMWKRFLVAVGKPDQVIPEESLLLREFERRFQPHEEVLGIAQKMKENGYPLAILSNNNIAHLSFLRTTHILDLFGVKIFSNELGLEKPTHEIYKIVLKQLNLSPDETFFVDDLLENVEAANDLGIHGIHFENSDKLRKDIEDLGVNLA